MTEQWEAREVQERIEALEQRVKKLEGAKAETSVFDPVLHLSRPKKGKR